MKPISRTELPCYDPTTVAVALSSAFAARGGEKLIVFRSGPYSHKLFVCRSSEGPVRPKQRRHGQRPLCHQGTPESCVSRRASESRVVRITSLTGRTVVIDTIKNITRGDVGPNHLSPAEKSRAHADSVPPTDSGKFLSSMRPPRPLSTPPSRKMTFSIKTLRVWQDSIPAMPACAKSPDRHRADRG